MKVVYGGYGHHPSGKQYVYVGEDTLRTGQQVNVPVTNKWSGRTYNTMFTIQRTSASTMGENEINRLEGMGINLKAVNGTDVLTLPGAEGFSSKAEWKRYSQAEYEQEIMRRLGEFTQPTDLSGARQRLLGE